MNDRFIVEVRLDWDAIEASSYLHCVKGLRAVSVLSFTRDVTFFVGDNGTGKSTLLEGIAQGYGLNAEGGTQNYQFSTFEKPNGLSNGIRLSRGYRKPGFCYFYRSDNYYNLASQAFDYDSVYGEHHLHQQSHGEGVFSFLQAFQREGLYLLDEPEAGLSIQRQLALLIQIAEMSRTGSQFIIITHSPILLSVPEADIWSFDGEGVQRCTYEETESYRIMKRFINDREGFVARLLA